ncbi:hypothetical protein MA16_Dca028278 [Dendrobium catenatum]|uniref:Uncharacterized protein n=1 Tax=Dendrobium catenatum TaxID=906689 RepID=A0A2I0V9Z2_9ASPA|nr:hypothetical protein MA16_Dca028278 [Dendrobium catenatum]
MVLFLLLSQRRLKAKMLVYHNVKGLQQRSLLGMHLNGSSSTNQEELLKVGTESRDPCQTIAGVAGMNRGSRSWKNLEG